MAAQVVLVEATPRNPADGAAVTVRLAGGGAVAPYVYGGQHWRAGLTALPKSIASLDFDGEQIGGGGVAQAIELGWAPSSRAALTELSALYWTDAPVTVRVGPEGGVLPPIITSGLVLEAAVAGGVLKIGLADQAADLKRPLLVDRFLGTGGIEGPVEFTDLIKSRAWGRCFNVPGRQLDAANNIWVFGDPRRRWQSFDQVRDRGAAAATSTLTVLAWQGTAEATFAALLTTAVIEGGGVLCPSIACIKWWTAPSGDLHADIRGETDGGYVETAPQIVARIVAARSTIPFAAGAVASAILARPAVFGWRVDTDSATAAGEISEMLGGLSTSWLLVDGAIVFRHWDWTASTRTARSFAVTRRSTVKPTASRKLGYRRNWSPMARGDLAAIVLSTDVVYEDGTPIEDLKPAEPGATSGAPIGTNIGGRPVVSVLDHVDGNTFREVVATAEAEVSRLRTRALSLLGPAGEDSYTLIRRETTERRDADGVFAETFEILGAVTPDGTAFVMNTSTVRIGADESFAQRFAAIAATFADNAASIEHIDQVLVGPDGASARALVKVDVNGRIIGTALTNDGTEGSFVVSADNFRIEDPDTGNPFFYADDAGKVLMHNVEVDTLKVGSVNYDSMTMGAAQKAAWTTLDADFQIPQGQTLAVFTLPFVKEDVDSVLEIQAFLNAKSLDDLQFDITIQIDGMVMQGVPGVNLILDTGSSQAQTPITPFVFASGIAAGEHVITVKAYNREVDNVPLTVQLGSTLKVVELRKASIGSVTGSGGALPPPSAGGGDYEGGGSGSGSGSGTGGAGMQPIQQV